MSEQVKRYCMDQTGCEIEDPAGVWVRADDFDALRAELTALIAQDENRNKSLTDYKTLANLQTHTKETGETK